MRQQLTEVSGTRLPDILLSLHVLTLVRAQFRQYVILGLLVIWYDFGNTISVGTFHSLR